jgi:thioester reductase-like protein
MADKSLLITGAGGFLGRFIIDRYLTEYPHTLYLLEHGAFLQKLRDHIGQSYPDAESSGRVVIFEGDITKEGLGLDDSTRADLQEHITGVIHLAALYHLAAPRDVLMRINVDGTRNLLDFCRELPRLERFGHISTLAVAGTYEGVFADTDFDKGQTFKNYYEETKYLSEKLVREYRDTIPSVIFRPPVVVGHSKTGYIEKVDGPYYLFETIARNLHFIMPDCGPVKCHIAPVDFVTDGMVEVFEKDETATGKVCCLMDPDPVTYNTFVDLACQHWPKFKPLLRVPFGIMKPVAKWSIFEKLSGIPFQAFQYGDQPIEYAFEESTERLAKVGLRCPRLPDYMDVLVRYYKEHLQDTTIRRGDWRNILKP